MRSRFVEGLVLRRRPVFTVRQSQQQLARAAAAQIGHRFELACAGRFRRTPRLPARSRQFRMACLHAIHSGVRRGGHQGASRRHHRRPAGLDQFPRQRPRAGGKPLWPAIRVATSHARIKGVRAGIEAVLPRRMPGDQPTGQIREQTSCHPMHRRPECPRRIHPRADHLRAFDFPIHHVAAARPKAA